MKKIETLWHHILYEALTHQTFKFTQQELAVRFSYSLSTVHHALAAPSRIGAIRKESKFFVLSHPMKFLLYWASVRNLSNNICYSTYYEGPILKAQGELPAGGIYGGYTAAKHILGTVPADYDKIYYYYQDPENFRRRFPPNHKHSDNIFVLSLPNIKEYIENYPGGTTSLPNTFVDIWNMADWFAADFTRALEEKIDGLLS